MLLLLVVLCSVLLSKIKTSHRTKRAGSLGFPGCVCLFSFLLITDSRARAELARRGGARAGVTWGLLLSLAVEC